VLADWQTHGAELLAEVGVEAALPLVEDATRSPESTLRLTAVALNEGYVERLAALRCVVLADGDHIQPPTKAEPWAVAITETPLAKELGVERRLHQVYSRETDEARRLLGWLEERGALVQGSPAELLQHLAAAGTAGRRIDSVLADSQLIALRDAFENL